MCGRSVVCLIIDWSLTVPPKNKLQGGPQVEGEGGRGLQETETRAVMCYPLGLLLSVEQCGRRECCCRVLALLSVGQCPHVLAG